jgi:hypothetical protein
VGVASRSDAPSQLYSRTNVESVRNEAALRQQGSRVLGAPRRRCIRRQIQPTRSGCNSVTDTISCVCREVQGMRGIMCSRPEQSNRPAARCEGISWGGGHFVGRGRFVCRACCGPPRPSAVTDTISCVCREVQGMRSRPEPSYRPAARCEGISWGGGHFVGRGRFVCRACWGPPRPSAVTDTIS